MSAKRKSTTNTMSDPVMNLRPPERGCWEALCLFLYNKEEGTFLNRTCLSWAKILAFYAVFYAVLAGFFAVCMYFMLKTIDPEVPKFYGDSSVLHSPGMAVRPHPPVEGNRLMMWSVNESVWKSTVTTDSDMSNFTSDYLKIPFNSVPCDFGKNCTEKWPEGSKYHEFDSCKEEIPKGTSCEVRSWDWGECAPKPGLFELTRPCMYFRLNKLYKWRPQYYEDSQMLPETMPEFLKLKIDNTPVEMRDRVWLSCEVIKPGEEKKIQMGKLTYYPLEWEGSFPGYYYPWYRQYSYRSPVVAVHFSEMPYDTLLNVDCKIWAKNIPQDKKHEVAWLSFKMKFLFSDTS